MNQAILAAPVIQGGQEATAAEIAEAVRMPQAAVEADLCLLVSDGQLQRIPGIASRPASYRLPHRTSPPAAQHGDRPHVL